ncbi:MAG: cytosine permease, partial [Oscillospiraceae bacterium]
MEKVKTSVFSNGLIWFGAAVSISEILTGTLVAPLGFGKGLASILIGHLIGCVLLFLAGLIGAQTEKSSMETVKISFGQKGSLLFSVLNVLQLVGWTAVMILNGAAAANFVTKMGGNWFWAIAIGVLIIIWLVVGLKNLSKINIIAMGGLFILTVILCLTVFKGDALTAISDQISFGAAVELSVAMPLSWLTLISDYTRTAKKKKMTAAVSASVYFF